MTDAPEIIPVAPRSRIELRVLPDGMSAFAKVGAGPRQSAAELDASLQSFGIRHGIDEDAHSILLGALDSEEPLAGELAIARGTAAGASRAGYFEPAFQPGLQPGHVRADGTIDFHDRELLKPVDVGHVLGLIYPPALGEPGVRVDGTLVTAEAAPALEMRVGPGAELAAEGRVIATRAGVVIYVDGRSIEVGTHYVHEGDVDFRSGDLFMEGSLLVRSDVLRGFAVRATGNLDVKGGIEGGSAYAGANLQIYGGVRGGEGARVSAGGDLRARHAERARLDCGGVLEITDAVNCDLSAVQIRVERSLRGGRAAAEVGLVTRDAGTATSDVPTAIEAAVPREAPEADALRALESAKAERAVARRAPGPRSGTGERAKGGKFSRELAHAQRGSLARKIERVERIHALLPHAFVEVRGTAHPGVEVRIGDARLQLEEAMRNVRFTLDLVSRTIRTEVASR